MHVLCLFYVANVIIVKFVTNVWWVHVWKVLYQPLAVVLGNILIFVLSALWNWRYFILLFCVFCYRFRRLYLFLLWTFLILLKFGCFAFLNLFDFILRSFFEIISGSSWYNRTNIRWSFQYNLLIDIFRIFKCRLVMFPLIGSIAL